ncbi:uncharacterized protein T551_01632 [Pneumocystis jirovecii RU7]|uniref:Uncharacterized protein n=1 Tax=Pneumocystis jirovecii (strain RU7) TaxID=1408657 RepID=A0A0W4ZRT1_PNEJ7|nr:uncharacterized protein T551_01632 [Pneumocystis jirovecii RU7]KTW31080.1 hypothetical protein T551_01632 [Pneumocystis jirovecii RU7]
MNKCLKNIKFQEKYFHSGVLKDKCNEQNKALLGNPYAQALISPIRRDILTDARLPSAFLLRFLACINPQTNKIWILPNGLKHTVVKKIAQSRWIVNNKKCIKFVGRGTWKRMLPDFAPLDAIWRSDMDDFVLTQFRKRIMIELKNIEKYFLDIQLVNDVFVRDTKSDDLDKKIGCIIHKFDNDEVWCLKNVVNQEFRVPVINASTLYDVDDTEDEWLRTFVSTRSIALPLGIETVNAISWLWKFRSYI